MGRGSSSNQAVLNPNQRGAANPDAPVIELPSQDRLMDNAYVDGRPETMFVLTLDPEARKLYVSEQGRYDGEDMEVWNGRMVELGSTQGVTNREQLLADLEAMSDDLTTICDGYEDEWDGSNYKGTYTDEAREAIERVSEQLDDDLLDLAPQIRDTDEICEGWLYGEHNREEAELIIHSDMNDPRVQEILDEMADPVDSDVIVPSREQIEEAVSAWRDDARADLDLD